jgi:peptidoglycan hydrolase-like protein with peptidoglycan-binding domain
LPFAAPASFTHPVAGLQLSIVQTLPSSQFGGGPPLQFPPPQTSPVVQAFPSLHGLVLLVWTQPVAGLQESSVQGLLSLQSGAGPPLQVPPPQTSPVVQAFPSSQGLVLFV